MRPIPKRLLPDTAAVKLPDDESEYGGALKDKTHKIRGVRYERTASVRKTDYQLVDGTTGIVFIDAVNSEGAFEVPAGAVISIGKDEMYVNATHRYEGACGRVHHWELEVR